MVQRLLRFPKTVAGRDGEPIMRELTGRAVMKKALLDVRALREGQTTAEGLVNAPSDLVNNTFTFTVALITYSTLICAWAAELGGVYSLISLFLRACLMPGSCVA